MAISHVGTQGTPSGATLSINSGTVTCQADDIVIGFHAVNQLDGVDRFQGVANQSGMTATVDAWTLIATNTGADGAIAGRVYATRVTAPGTVGVNFTTTASRVQSATIIVLRGANVTIANLLVAETKGGPSTTPTSGNVTPHAASDWIVGLMAIEGKQDISPSSVPSAWTERAEVRFATDADNATDVTCLVETIAPASASAIQAAPTTQFSRLWWSVAIAVGEAGAGGGTPNPWLYIRFMHG